MPNPRSAPAGGLSTKLGPAEMERIADLFAAVLVEGRNVKAEALELRAGYQRIHYTFAE